MSKLQKSAPFCDRSKDLYNVMSQKFMNDIQLQFWKTIFLSVENQIDDDTSNNKLHKTSVKLLFLSWTTSKNL